jgi:hypothetical protein
VIEHWNSANGVIFYGKDSELTGADRESQEVSMLALHLLQSTLVHINTLLLQQVLAEPEWAARLTEADLRALTPLFWSNINPYGTFHLDMDTRLRPRARRGVATAELARLLCPWGQQPKERACPGVGCTTITPLPRSCRLLTAAVLVIVGAAWAI